jgi:hypothetical protein
MALSTEKREALCSLFCVIGGYTVTSLANRPLAMLIDGDNAQTEHVAGIIQILNRVGDVSVRRVYGDFSQQSLKRWHDTSLKNNLDLKHHFNNTVNKNSTDSNLMIDAMDLLYEGNLAGFCIVSSDSDYTRLALRIRQSGRFVIGVGRGHTPMAFVKACNAFLYVERIFLADSVQNFQPMSNGKAFSIERILQLPSPTTAQSIGTKRKRSRKKKPIAQVPIVASEASASPATKSLAQFVSLLQDAYSKIGREWVNVESLANMVLQLDPSFSPKAYNASRFTKLLERFPYVIEIRKSPSGKGNQVRIR